MAKFKTPYISVLRKCPKKVSCEETDSVYSVILPRTNFPLRAAMAERSEGFVARWERFELWDRLRARADKQSQKKIREPFILHDGPPYANGHLHMGHALNKILKDIVNRARQMQGYDAQYIPGWDCHGLPIEWKVEEEYRAKGKSKDDVSIADFRKRCRDFATEWIGIQSREFRALGLLGDWVDPYLTMDYKSEARIVSEIGKFLVSGNLSRNARPVLWSIAEKTALADAEVEYERHSSQAIHVAFPLDVASCEKLELEGDTAILIWTTTPWTIPANRAIAFNKDFTYCLARDDGTGQAFLIECDRFVNDNHMEWTHLERTFTGEQLAGLHAQHPLARHADSKISAGYGYEVPLLAADYVTREQGTGFVHSAPAHGEDDFILGKKHGLACENTVDAEGYYTEVIGGFTGARIFDENGKEGDANSRVLEALKQTKLLLRQRTWKHDYPHSWRSKTPLIFRNTSQWFIRMDWRGTGEGGVQEQTLREKALAEIASVSFYPAEGKKRLSDMIATRPDWCVSRQRLWGVPLPIFTDRQTGEPLREQSVIDRISEVFAKEGAGSWYVGDAQRFLPAPYKIADYEQCQDIVEVWFDSGSTHAFVLEPRLGVERADLYLEGSDQHRGWFHSSLLQACGTKGKAPYRAVLTHGFVLDKDGRKMSKSLGNIIAPQKVLQKHGADILRLWVASSNYTGDLRIGEEILKSCSDSYRRFRNTLRFLLGNLEASGKHELPNKLSELPVLERVLLATLAELDETLDACIENYNFTSYINRLHDFCNGKLSSWYFDIRKDCLYCDRKDEAKRRHCLAVMEILFEFLTSRLAPILPFTAEDAFQSLLEKRSGEKVENYTDSIHLHDFVKIPKGWHNKELVVIWDSFLKKDDWFNFTNQGMDELRKNKQLGSSLEARLIFPYEITGEELFKGIERASIAELLAELFIVSDVRFANEATVAGYTDLSPLVEKIEGWGKCARCWKFNAEVGKHEQHPELCTRCFRVVAQ